MDLKSGNPYYLIKNGLFPAVDTLQSNQETDVLIIGGGITGALVAYQLIKRRIGCIVVDSRSLGLGSTCASTSLLQYEIDKPLCQLEKLLGRANAELAYKYSSSGIDIIKEISEKINFSDFRFCKSVYFSQNKSGYLEKEFESRRKAGFEVEYLEKDELFSRYGLKAHSAICSGKAAKIDAYLFTGLLHRQNINNQNVQVFERTTVTKMKNSDSSITAETEHGFTIRCRKVIHATGYEALERWSKKLVELKSTYACVSEPIAELPPFFEHTLFWNTEDPYLYIREDSGRIIIGGRDEKYYDPRKRKLLLERKTKALVGDFMKLFPGIKFNPEFEWAGTFASTPDGLPFIGQNEKVPNHYYALGYGGNGITFSAVASVLLAELISDNSEVIPKIFSFNR